MVALPDRLVRAYRASLLAMTGRTYQLTQFGLEKLWYQVARPGSDWWSKNDRQKLAYVTGTSTANHLANRLFSNYSTAPSAWYRGLVVTLIDSLVTAGVWTSFDAVWVSYALSQEDSYLDWTTHGRDLSPTGSPGWNAATGGWTFNGTSQYLSMNIATSLTSLKGVYNMTQNAHCFGARWLTGTANAGAVSNDFGTPSNKIARNAAGTQDNIRSSRNTNSNATTVATGHKVVSRTASNVWRTYLNGTVFGTDPRTDVTDLYNFDTWYLGANSASAFGINTLSFAHIGGALSSAQVASMSTAFATFVTAFLLGP